MGQKSIQLNRYILHNLFINAVLYAEKMAEKTSAVESLACGLAQIALSSTHFVEENCTEPRNPKCRSATNSPQASPLANHKLDALPKSASLDVLIPEDKSSASNGTHKVKPSKPRRSHSYQPTGKGGYDDHKHKEVGISINVKLMLYTLVAELLLWGQTPCLSEQKYNLFKLTHVHV